MRRGRPSDLTAEQAGNRTVLVGLELLKAVAKAPKPAALTTIARDMGMSPSRIHRYLASLCHAGFVTQDEETGRYGVGPEAIGLGLSAVSRLDGMALASSVMEGLSAATRLASYLSVWSSNGPIVVRREMQDVQTVVRVREGSTMSMLTATGMVFLAHLPRAQTRPTLLRDIESWARESGADALDEEEVWAQAERVKDRGMAKTVGMRNPTWAALSCPVFGEGDRFKMSLTLIGVSTLFDTRLNGEVALRLKETSQRLSSGLVKLD